MPLLSICIPTFNRGPFLEKCLKSISDDIERLQTSRCKIEIHVFDNDSEDDTANIVAKFRTTCPEITYSKNEKNFGSDYNIAQCYNRSAGEYLWILGDDEQITPQTLSYILNLIQNADGQYGVIYLNPYSYNKKEFNPPPISKKSILTNSDDFIKKVHVNAVFISSILFKKDPSIDALQFRGTWLVQWYILLQILKKNKTQLITQRYSLIAKRENSADTKAGLGVDTTAAVGVTVSHTFVQEFLSALKTYKDDKSFIETVKFRLLFNFVIYELAFVHHGIVNMSDEMRILGDTYDQNFYFRWYVRPLLKKIHWWPCRIMLLLTSLVSRSTKRGELLKILTFIRHNSSFLLAKLK